MPGGQKRKIVPGPTAKKFYRAAQGKKAAAASKTTVKRAGVRPYTARKRCKTTVNANTHNAFLYSNKILHVPQAFGSFVNVPTVWRNTLSTGSSRHYYVAVFATASDLVGLLIYGDTGYSNALTAPQLAAAAPISIRPMRLSVSVRNTSKSDQVGGSIKILNSPQHVKLEWQTGAMASYLTTSSKDSLVSLMSTSPHVKCYSGKELTHTHVTNAPPASSVEFRAYREFITWDGSTGITRDAANVDIIGAAQTRMVSNMIIFELTTNPEENTYDIGIHSQSACRFHHENILSNMAHDPRPAQEQAFAAGVHAAQQAATQNPLAPVPLNFG